MSQRAVIVVGMHRSGTSAVSGILGKLGVFMGRSLYAPQKGVNEKGFWENAAIVAFNEGLFDSLLWSWDAPHAHAVGGHLDRRALAASVEKARSLLAREYGNRPLWGFKDPRVSLLLPFWQDVLGGRDVDVFHLLMLRNPLEVTASLAKRDHFSLAKSLALWLNYTLSSYWHASGRPLLILGFESLLADPIGHTRTLCRWLGLPTGRAEAAAGFVSPRLKHQTADAREGPKAPVTDLALAVYRELNRSSPDTAALRRLTEEYLAYQSRLDPVLLEHLEDVKREEVKYRRLFEEAYGSLWWKVSYPMRRLERALRGRARP